jgi:heterodisulfide reductase subunit A-like polyferredoxin
MNQANESSVKLLPMLLLKNLSQATENKKKGPLKILFDRTKCVGCGLCIELCPRQAVHINKLKAAPDPEKCDDCGYCLNLCICNAISRENSVKQSALNFQQKNGRGD